MIGFENHLVSNTYVTMRSRFCCMFIAVTLFWAGVAFAASNDHEPASAAGDASFIQDTRGNLSVRVSLIFCLLPFILSKLA